MDKEFHNDKENSDNSNNTNNIDNNKSKNKAKAHKISINGFTDINSNLNVAAVQDKINLGLSEQEVVNTEDCQGDSTRHYSEKIEIIYSNAYLKNEFNLKIIQATYDSAIIETLFNVFNLIYFIEYFFIYFI